MRSPSGSAPGSIRGTAPVATSTAPAWISLATSDHRVRAGQLAVPGDDLDPFRGQAQRHVRGLRLGQRLDPAVQPRSVHHRLPTAR